MNSPKPYSRFYSICKITTLILLPLVAFLALLPTILSTSWGTKVLTKAVNSQIPGTIHIQKLELQWFGGQVISGFELHDPEGNPVADADIINLDTALFRLLITRTPIGQLSVSLLNATLKEDSKGVSNLQHAIGTNETPAFTHTPMTTPIYLRHVSGNLNLPSDTSRINAHLKGDTSQGTLTGHFIIDADLNHVDLESVKNMQLAKESNGTLKIMLDNFPVPIIDQVMQVVEPKYTGIFRAALGDTLNMSIDNSIADNGIGFHALFNSPYLNGKVDGSFKNGVFSASGPEPIRWKITPAFMEKLNPGSLLKAPVELSLDLDAITIPVKDAFDLKKILLKAKVSSGELSFGENLIKGFQIDLDLPKSLNISQFPIALIDYLKGLDGLATAALGSEADIKVNLKPDNIYDVQVQSDKLSVVSFPLKINGNVELTQPVSINFLINLGLIHKLAPAAPNLELANDVSALIKIQKFIFPLDGKMKKGSIDADVSLASLTFSNLPGLGNSRLTNLSLKAQGPSLENIAFQFHSELESFNHEGITPEVLGGALAININGNLAIDADQNITVPEVKGKLDSDRINLSFAGNYESDHLFRLINPAEFNFLLTPEAMRDLGLANPGQPVLENPTSLKLIVYPQGAALGKGLEGLKLSGKMSLGDVSLGVDGSTLATLAQLNIPWELDSQQNTIRFDLTAKTNNKATDTKGSLDGHIWVKEWLNKGSVDLNHLKIDTQIFLQNLPIAILNAFTGRDDLLHLLGSTVNANLNSKVDLGEHPNGAITFNIDTPLLTANADLTINNAITLSSTATPAQINWKLTSEGFSRLRKILKSEDDANKDGLLLAHPTLVQVKIASINLPLDTSKPFATGGLTANVSVDSLTVMDTARNQGTVFENIVAHFNSQNLSDSIAFHLSGKDGKAASGIRTELVFDGYIQNLFTKRGKWNAKEMTVIAESKAEALPIVLLANLMFLDTAMQEKVDALIGDTMDVQMNVYLEKMNGKVDATLKGVNGNATLGAALNDGVLTLTKPFQAEVMLTPKLSKSILQDIMPLFSSAKGSKSPIKILIDPDGFSIPVHPFEISQAQIAKASLEIGRVEFRNEGQLGTVLELLKPINADQLSVWFTPIYFNIKNGVVKCERADMLINEYYPVATWGKVDLVKDRVNMVIGLTGVALQNALNIKGIDKKDMLQIPVTGTIADAKLDKAKATTRITALLAQTQGGLKGKILGTMLQLATEGGDPRPPSPTTYPFPWSNEPSVNDYEDYSSIDGDSTSENEPVDPVKQIEKTASHLINQFLK